MPAQIKGIELKQKINSKQSQALVKDLVSISLNCITFLRNIFGDENYVDRRFICSETPEMKSSFVKTKHLVRGISKEADLFKNWIECGVNNALSLQYLSALQFGIYIDENEPEKLSETYIFKFDYNNENISFGINDGENCEPLPELTAREKVQQLIKRLIVLTQTFGPLPEKKHITVRLLFNEKCPRDYQPSFFKDASDLKSPTITVDNKNSNNNIGTLDTGHNYVNIRILTNVGIEIKNSRNLDPFDLIEDSEDNFALQDYDNEIDFPKTNNSLSLNKYLFSNKPDNIHSTQLVPPSQSYYSGIFKLTCECNCWASASRIKLSMKGFAILTCRTCSRQVHSCCYGLNHTKHIKASAHNFECYSCMLNTDELYKDLKLLMRLRYLWKHMSCYGIPESTDLFYEIFGLTSNVDDNVVRKMSNKLFQDKILVVLERPIIVKRNKNAMGTGYFTPSLSMLLDNKGNSLVKDYTYTIAFTPIVKSPKLVSHTDKQRVYLPDTLNTKEYILELLNEFKTSSFKDSELDDDPIISSSPVFDSKTFNKKNREFVKPDDKTKKNLVHENLAEEFDDLSFEDSLNFLSQPVDNQDSQSVNFLENRVSQPHIQSSKRKLDSSISTIEHKVKNRKISVNEDTCF